MCKNDKNPQRLYRIGLDLIFAFFRFYFLIVMKHDEGCLFLCEKPRNSEIHDLWTMCVRLRCHLSNSNCCRDFYLSAESSRIWFSFNDRNNDVFVVAARRSYEEMCDVFIWYVNVVVWRKFIYLYLYPVLAIFVAIHIEHWIRLYAVRIYWT